MNKAKLKTYAPQARKDFIAAVTARAHRLGLSDHNGQLQITPAEKSGDLVIIAGQSWPSNALLSREWGMQSPISNRAMNSVIRSMLQRGGK